LLRRRSNHRDAWRGAQRAVPRARERLDAGSACEDEPVESIGPLDGVLESAFVRRRTDVDERR